MPTLANFGVGAPGILMPKSVNQFRLIFEDFGTNTKNLELTQNIIKCSCPSIDMSFDLSQFSLFLRNNRWNPIKIVLRDDLTNIVHDEVMNQVKGQLADENRRFRLKIQAIEGVVLLHEVILTECKISKYSSNDWDYSSSKPKTISLNVMYTLA